MPDVSYILAALAVIMAVTFALRAVPFAVIAPLRSSALVHYLGEHMPVGIMLILAVYTLRNVSIAPASLGPAVAALAVTIGLHLWRRHALLSILGGTATYMVLVNWVFG
ncbi:branched-subunit amino acid transport protein AzlD [Rhodococcus sp. LBL1]|uniref:Branched-subunit amino acid transport protein AzlD n=1 Tax=Prescottella agglutinans TaxID=1644129 RepID=A0ABT6MHQ7_9NOCA|nr:AzlD domain-containing protein [Prescottella agglutinans]MDH6283857.1 branched-subunit amino acid transport protein AzlD [Prescottella agglutinans]MDH6676822.1 branched-subunit amino acid transport protein AzlD [Rhodococcus sp. LBL1]MDH6682885.1 branched-subunit amino acid transport protein AzlD [Rhodococcus sp. LBL2]